MTALLLLAWCCSIFCSLVHCQETQEKQVKQVIHLLSLLPYYNPEPSLSPSFDDGQNIQPALELAQDQINNSSTLLENYTLNLIFAEDGCNIATRTTVSFVSEAFSTRGRLTGILGPSCSLSTIELSSLTNRTDLVMVHGAGTSAVADRTKYPHLFGTLGSTGGFVQALLHLLNRAQWKRVAVLHDDARAFYLDTKRSLLEAINQLNDTRVEFLSPVSPTFIPIAAFEQSHLRITFVLCPASLTRKIICLSFNRSEIFRAHQWVFADHRLEVLLQPIEFVFDGIQYNCSRSDMATALEMNILITYSLTAANDSMLVSNTTYKEYRRYYTEYRERYNREDARAIATARNSTYTVWATYLYDAVWAWALVLNNLTETQESFEVGADYGNLQQSEMIMEQFYRTRFQGMSGEISFGRNTGFTDRDVDVVQIRNRTPYRIGSSIDGVAEFIFIADSFPSSVRENRVLTIFTACVTIIQVVIVVVLHTLTVIYRKQPSIKASSPKQLHISYFGIYMVGLGLFMYFLFLGARLPINMRHYFCQLLWGWCLPIGFMLSMAPVAMRTWRVYRIFKHYLNPGPLISDPVLIVGIVVLLVPVLTTSIIWNVIDPFQVEKIFGNRTSNGMFQVKEECICAYYYVWFGALLIYSIAILILLSIFSLLTCNIPNRSFATTALRVLSYIMTISFLLGFPLFYLFNATFDPNYSTAILAIQMNVMMVAFTACVFVPPMFPILRGLKQRVRKISQASVSSGTAFISPGYVMQ